MIYDLSTFALELILKVYSIVLSGKDLGNELLNFEESVNVFSSDLYFFFLYYIRENVQECVIWLSKNMKLFQPLSAEFIFW